MTVSPDEQGFLRPWEPELTGTPGVARAAADTDQSVDANISWWDEDADAYHQVHGEFLGEVRLVWCPENLLETNAQLLGPAAELRGKRVLEVGCGAASSARWVAAQGGRAVGFDVSSGMLRHARTLNRTTGTAVPLVQADAQFIPFRDDLFDIAFTAFGAVPFVADSARLMREVARVLVPGGRWVFATTHPIRWSFPDDPGPRGLTLHQSYFDRRPYVEFNAQGGLTYVEHHRTFGDRVREIVAAGLRLVDVIEPEWPADLDQEWGQWSPLRGALMPGSVIFVCELPAV